MKNQMRYRRNAGKDVFVTFDLDSSVLTFLEKYPEWLRRSELKVHVIRACNHYLRLLKLKKAPK
jgi:hypothetical protein